MSDNSLDAWTKLLGVVERKEVHEIEVAIFNSMTFRTLISQSGNHAHNCARDIARDVYKAISVENK